MNVEQLNKTHNDLGSLHLLFYWELFSNSSSGFLLFVKCTYYFFAFRILLWTLFGLTVFIMALMICYLICRMPEIVSSLEVYYHQRMESRAESQRTDRERKRALKQQQELERQLEQEMRDRKKELEREMSEKLASLKRDKRRMVASVPVAAPESIEIPQILAAPSPSQILATPPPSIDEPAFLPVPERHSRPTFFIGHNNQPMHLEISCELAKRRQARLKDDKE